MKFIVRVDDFPWDREKNHDSDLKLFKTFYDVINKYEINIVLGVIPAIILPEDIAYLKTLERVIVATHGYNHVGHDIDTGEFTTLSYAEKKKRIEKGRNILKDFNVIGFIPPFDSFDNELVQILYNNGYRYITGRNENDAIRYMGNLVYLPSAMNLYSKARTIFDNLHKLDTTQDIIKVITLHCTWEYLTIPDLELLCGELKGRTILLDDNILNDIKQKIVQRDIQILRVTYGNNLHNIVVTNRFKELSCNGQIGIKVSNNIGGDPITGQKKWLKVVCVIDGRFTTKTFGEGELVIL